MRARFYLPILIITLRKLKLKHASFYRTAIILQVFDIRQCHRYSTLYLHTIQTCELCGPISVLAMGGKGKAYTVSLAPPKAPQKSK